MHDWLVGLVLEVAVPSAAELWARPLVHHLQLRLVRSDLDTSLDTVGSQWSRSVCLPLIVDLLLYDRVAANEVVKRLCAWLCAVCSEVEVVVLEVQTKTVLATDVMIP